MDLITLALARKSSGGGDGGGSATDDYNDLLNKPQIDGVELSGNKTLADLGAQPATDETLETTDKTVVGAINEIYAMVAAIAQTVDEINGEVV